MDRYTVAAVLNDIGKNWDPELNAGQKGLIQTAFIVCYFASAPIFGFLGDRYSRKWLMAFGVVAWGICTVASSFMKNFDTYIPFLLLRSAIGFGEAGFTSIAPTVLGDLFEGSQRSIVLALFYFAIPVGSGLGYVVGSQVAAFAGDWAWGLRVTPFLNIVALVLLIFFLIDPPRGDHDVQKLSDSKESNFMEQMKSWGQDLMYLLTNKSYMLSTIAFTSLTFCTGALSWFGPEFVENALSVRMEHQLPGYENDIDKDMVGLVFGAILSAAGIVGLILGSGLSYLLRKKIAWIDPVICGTGLLLSFPLIFGALYVSDSSVTTAFVLIFFGEAFLNMNWAVVVDISLYVVVPLRRSSAEAFQLLAAHAFGEAGSPYVTGAISDSFTSSLENEMSKYNETTEMTQVEKDFHSMQFALYISLAFEILAAIMFFWTTFYVVSDRKKAEDSEKQMAQMTTTLGNTVSEKHH